MEKKFILPLAGLFLLLGFYPILLQQFYPEYGKTQKAARAAASSPGAASSFASSPVSASSAGITAQDYSAEKDVLFKNDKLRLTYSETGGAIREIAFLEYMDDWNRDPLKLISAKNPSAAPFSVEFISPAADSKAVPSRITIDRENVALESAVLGGDVRMTRKYVFRPSGYSADLSVTFENVSDKTLDLRYKIFAGSRVQPRHEIDTQYIEANFFSTAGGKPSLKHIKEHGLGKKAESPLPLDWLALKDRHFSVIVKPKGEAKFTGLVEGLGSNQFAASLVSTSASIPPGQTVTHEFLVFIGPNDLGELLPLGLEDIVNFGKMDLIGKIFIGALEMLYKIFRNYGVAIIALTILINVFLFPLTRHSFMSMKRMQLVQPQMTKLRDKYKDNPTQLNKEMMELYKKHKVNPFGGCLPLLLQMPVFIALYVAISKFVKLIGADFLWVRDLSSPDNVAIPFALPFLGNQIHILPLIMIAGMVVQQRISAASMEGQDPAMVQQQKMMAVMMPIIFGFIFYSMPSALVLYWLTNTVLMTSYQLYLKRVTVT